MRLGDLQAVLILKVLNIHHDVNINVPTGNKPRNQKANVAIPYKRRGFQQFLQLCKPGHLHSHNEFFSFYSFPNAVYPTSLWERCVLFSPAKQISLLSTQGEKYPLIDFSFLSNS